MANLTLVSPLRGWCAPLDETPDAVFAQRLLGDGVAIDPMAVAVRNAEPAVEEEREP